MLSQDELDKLLEEGMDDGGEKPPEEEGGGETEKASGADEAGAAEDVSWDDAFKEAAEGGDAAAQKALSEEEEKKDAERPKEPSPQAKRETDKGGKSPEFTDFGREGPGETVEHPDLDFILDIPLDVSVELGRTKLRIKDLLKLGQGSVVELNKLAGEPAEIYVNQKLMAKGEIVVVNEKFGVRLTEIISPSDRVKQLG